MKPADLTDQNFCILYFEHELDNCVYKQSFVCVDYTKLTCLHGYITGRPLKRCFLLLTDFQVYIDRYLPMGNHMQCTD